MTQAFDLSIHEIRPKPKDGTPEAILQWHRDHVWVRTKKHRAHLLESGITVYNKRWQTDEASRNAIRTEVIYILGGRRVDGEIWYTADNEEQELSNEEYLGLSTCLKSYASKLISFSKIIKFAINRLATVEECHAYDYKDERLWPSSVFDSIPVGWTTKKIPILIPLLTKIDELETEVDALRAVAPIVSANNTRLRLYPSSRKRKNDYWVYLRIENQSNPEQELSFRGVQVLLELDQDPTTAYNCTWKKRDDGKYLITPNIAHVEAEKKVTLSLKFVNVTDIKATLIGYV